MAEDFLYSPEELRIQEQRKEQQRKEQDKRLADLNEIYSTPAGRREAWRKLEEYGLFRTSFDKDIAKFGFNEGRKSAAYDLVADMELARKGTFYQIFNEHMSVKPKDEL